MRRASGARAERVFAAVAVGVAMVVALAGCGDDADCRGEETVDLKMTGTCAPEPRTFTLVRSGCRLSVIAPPGWTGLPASGAVDQAQHPIRKGGWQLFGPVCPPGPLDCTGSEFRRCTATRVAFRLELTCIDGTGAPACTAELTE